MTASAEGQPMGTTALRLGLVTGGVLGLGCLSTLRRPVPVTAT